jgi:hypothetical protein
MHLSLLALNTLNLRLRWRIMNLNVILYRAFMHINSKYKHVNSRVTCKFRCEKEERSTITEVYDFLHTNKAGVTMRFGNMWRQTPAKPFQEVIKCFLPVSFLLVLSHIQFIPHYSSHVSKFICTQILQVLYWHIQGCLKIMVTTRFQERKQSATSPWHNEYSRTPI